MRRAPFGSGHFSGSKAGPMAQAFGQGLANRLTNGYPPSEVADQVVRGIREKRFYVVPAQPEVREAATIRARDIIELRNPTPRRIVSSAGPPSCSARAAAARASTCGP